MIFFSVSVFAGSRWGKNIFLRVSQRHSHSLMLRTQDSLSGTALVWSSGGEKRRQHNSDALSLCSLLSSPRTLPQNGSEGIVCLWFSFERVWSFFYWSKKTLSARWRRRRGSCWGETSTKNVSKVLRDKPPVFLLHIFSFFQLSSINIWFSYFFNSATSRRRIEVDRE